MIDSDKAAKRLWYSTQMRVLSAGCKFGMWDEQPEWLKDTWRHKVKSGEPAPPELWSKS